MKKLKKIKSGFLSRNLSLLKMASSIGKDIYLSNEPDKITKARKSIEGKLSLISEELGQMKGSVLKAGQMLSLYGQDFFPPEVQEFLNSMRGQTSFLEWEQIKNQIPEKLLKDLRIEEDAFAAASIGQVHKAYTSDNQTLAVKVQYKDIEKAIDSDLRVLKGLLKILNFFPENLKTDDLFAEIRNMLVQEMDYHQEARLMKKYSLLADGDYLIPQIFSDYCTDKVLTTEYIEAEVVEQAVKEMSEEQKKSMASEFFQLFLREVFQWKLMQTDAHAGNYQIKGSRWVLMDFGAVQELDNETASLYQRIILALADQDIDQVMAIALEFGAIDVENSDLSLFRDYCHLIATPLADDKYDWGESTIAEEAIKMSPQMMKAMKFHFIPHKNVFIDRKIAGVYSMLKTFGVALNLNKEVQKFREFCNN